MKSYSVLCILILIAIHSWGQVKIKKCDQDIITYTAAKIDKLNPAEIKSFLSTFDKSCTVNVEFSESSNELLFDVLDKYPSAVLNLLDKSDSKIQLSTIVDQLSYQLLDKVNIPDLIAKVENTKASEGLKRRIINSLQASSHQ
jgi:hypothetical protein